MKVALIYRRRQDGGFSIEELFRSIAGELRRNLDVIEYEVGGRWNTLIDIWRLRKLTADIYHVTADINYFVPLLPGRKTILTVHDIGHYQFSLRGLKRFLYKWIWLVMPLRSARAITAVSDQTRDDIVELLGVPRLAIEVIGNCHSPTFQPVIREFNANCPVILQVGTKPYKNVPRLIEALRGIPCRLVLIGHLDDVILETLDKCGVSYVNKVNLIHDEIYHEYVESDIVTFVSIGEGFGVPIIEAQVVGRPIVTSNVSPMKEVAGEGACLVDPLDVSQIREAVCKIISDERYREQLVNHGLHNAKRFSPPVIASRYLDLYRRVAEST